MDTSCGHWNLTVSAWFDNLITWSDSRQFCFSLFTASIDNNIIYTIIRRFHHRDSISAIVMKIILMILYLNVANRPKAILMFMSQLTSGIELSGIVFIVIFLSFRHNVYFVAHKKTHLQVCDENPEHVSPHCKQGCPSSTSVMRTP